MNQEVIYGLLTTTVHATPTHYWVTSLDEVLLDKNFPLAAVHTHTQIKKKKKPFLGALVLPMAFQGKEIDCEPHKNS